MPSRQQQWAPAGEPPPPIDLRTLCIIHGCLNPRHGLNLCTYHQRITTPRH